MDTLQCNGFKLRPLTIWDTDAYFETMQDPLTQQSMMSTPATRDEALKEVQGLLTKVANGVSEIFTIEVDGKYAGNVVLEHENYDTSNIEGRVHLWLHPKYRGQGLATKALGAVIEYGFRTKYKQIFAQCKASNAQVIKVNEALGFRRIREYTDEQGIKKIRWIKERQA